MIKDYGTMVDLAHHYALSTGSSVCVLSPEGTSIYQEPEDWFSPDLIAQGPFSRHLSVSFSGWVVWRSQIKKAGRAIATIFAGKQLSPATRLKTGVSGQAVPLALEIEGRERSQLEGLAHLLTISCQGLTGSLPSADSGSLALSGSLSQVEGFSLSSRLLCAMRARDFDRVRFFLERMGKALWQEEKADFSRHLALSLLKGLRESLGFPPEGGDFFLQEWQETFSASSLALWMDRVIKGWGEKELEDKSSHHAREAVRYLQENFRENIGLGELSQQVGLSSTYLSRLFKEQVGEGFVDYLAGLRIKEAKRLLEHSHKSLSEIARLCGFLDQSYFTKTFKKYEGLNPRKYRQSLERPLYR